MIEGGIFVYRIRIILLKFDISYKFDKNHFIYYLNHAIIIFVVNYSNFLSINISILWGYI